MGSGPDAEEQEITQAEMEPGEVLIYLGSLIHAGGQNRSELPRTGIALSYCLGWLRQSENQYFSAPPEIARYFGSELQQMLGYSVQRPIGHVRGADRTFSLANNGKNHHTRLVDA